MQPATVHLLTAFFAFAHRLALSADDEAALGRDVAPLSSKLWRATAGLLAEADRGAPGTSLDIISHIRVLETCRLRVSKFRLAGIQEAGTCLLR